MQTRGSKTRGGLARRRCAVALVAFGLLAAGCIPEGTHTVSSFGAGGMSPGLWRSLGTNPGRARAFPAGCGWGTGQRPHASSLGDGGPIYAEIRPADSEIWVSDQCLPFWQEPGPFAKPLATPGQP